MASHGHTKADAQRIKELVENAQAILAQQRPGSELSSVLVEFDPGYRIGLIHLAGVERELSVLLGRKADLRTPADLSRYFRDEVLREAEVQFAEG